MNTLNTRLNLPRDGAGDGTVHAASTSQAAMDPSALTAGHVAARLDRLPMSKWHVKLRMVVGAATFFDAFDSLAIASALPVLVGLWHIGPQQIGLLISAGFAGQLLGALLFGWVAERFGRLRSAMLAIAIFSVFSLACAFATGYTNLLVLRFIQGIGLGGEVPVAAIYINEFARTKSRGRFFLLFESAFTLGILVVSAVGSWVVPNLGWQFMFAFGAIPALIALYMRKGLPESPRWLVGQGRNAEAEQVLRSIEREVSDDGRTALPAPGPAQAAQVDGGGAPIQSLFRGMYLPRTLMIWVLLFSIYIVSYGVTTWFPTLMRTVYHLPVEMALRYNVVMNSILFVVVIVFAMVVDKIGRRIGVAVCYALTALPMGLIWLLDVTDPYRLMIFIGVSYAFSGAALLGSYLYGTELYPTRMRARGLSTATAVSRVAMVLSPMVVGMLLARAGAQTVFLMFACAGTAGLLATVFLPETKGKTLEQLSP